MLQDVTTFSKIQVSTDVSTNASQKSKLSGENKSFSFFKNSFSLTSLVVETSCPKQSSFKK
jgi:hypothetical protein